MNRQGRSQPNPGMERVRHQLRCTGVRTESPDKPRTGIHTRGYLPHVKREGANYFVTFRLADSLPKEVLLRFEQERAEELRRLARSHENPALYAEQINREFRRQLDGSSELPILRVDSSQDLAQLALIRSLS